MHNKLKNTPNYNKKTKSSIMQRLSKSISWKQKKWAFIGIIIVFFIVLSLRLIISFQATNMNKESYYSLDQAESILESGKSNMVNQLYDNSALPINNYILSFFGIFINLEIAAKILINLFISLSIVIIYFIVNEITKDNKIGLFAGIFAAFIPLLFKNYVNTFNAAGLSILAFLFTLLFFIKSINNTKFIRHFIISLIVLIIITPLSAIFITAFVIYFLMLNAEKIKIRPSEIEIFLFSLILGGWIYIILYKDAIISKGLDFLLHLPLASTIPQANFLFLGLIGIIPVLLGIIGIYFNTIKRANRQLIFITSFVVINLFFILLKIIDQEFSLILISFGLIISSGIALKEFKEFLDRSKSKLKSFYNIIIFIIIILFIISSVIPCITNAFVNTYHVPTNDDKIALEKLKNNSNPNSIVMTSVEDNYVVNYFADRKTILSSYDYSEKQRLDDTNQFFELNINIQALRILTLYNADYVFISETALRGINNKSLQKFEDTCYETVYKNKARVYKVLCTLKQEEELNELFFEVDNEES